MKKKGFTLVELLAVIVILAIIAVIATPIILNVIEDAKKGASESSAKGYLDAVEKQMVINLLDSDEENDITNGTYTVAALTKKGVTVKGDRPTDDSWIIIEDNKISKYELKIGDYIINSEKETSKNESINSSHEETYIAYNVGDSVIIDDIGYHVTKSSSATEEYVTLLRDESIGEIPFNLYCGNSYEESNLPQYLNGTYKDTFGEKNHQLVMCQYWKLVISNKLVIVMLIL